MFRGYRICVDIYTLCINFWDQAFEIGLKNDSRPFPLFGFTNEIFFEAPKGLFLATVLNNFVSTNSTSNLKTN